MTDKESTRPHHQHGSAVALVYVRENTASDPRKINIPSQRAAAQGSRLRIMCIHEKNTNLVSVSTHKHGGGNSFMFSTSRMPNTFKSSKKKMRQFRGARDQGRKGARQKTKCFPSLNCNLKSIRWNVCRGVHSQGKGTNKKRTTWLGALSKLHRGEVQKEAL